MVGEGNEGVGIVRVIEGLVFNSVHRKHGIFLQCKSIKVQNAMVLFG